MGSHFGINRREFKIKEKGEKEKEKKGKENKRTSDVQ